MIHKYANPFNKSIQYSPRMCCEIIDRYLHVLIPQQLQHLLECQVEIEGVWAIEIVVVGVIVLLVPGK